MIDLKTLAMQENRHLVMEAAGFTQQGGAELRRLAMRYLALRERKVALQRGMDGITSIYGVWLDGIGLDAAADRLIQEMLK